MIRLTPEGVQILRQKVASAERWHRKSVRIARWQLAFLLHELDKQSEQKP